MRSLPKLCVLLLAAGLLIAPASGAAASKSKKKKSKTEEVAKPKVDKYTKMFVNDKSCLTAKGPFLTLHKLKGKLYVEVPLKTIGREMLIASTISEASDTNLGTIGYKPTDPIHVKFTRIDTTIYLSQAVVPPVHDTNDPHMSKAIGRSTLPPIMHSYPLVCYNRDSSAMVIEMTKFFSGDNELLAPIIDKAKSAIDKVAAAGGFLVVFDTSTGSLAYFDEATLTDVAPAVKKELGITDAPAAAPAAK